MISGHNEKQVSVQPITLIAQENMGSEYLLLSTTNNQNSASYLIQYGDGSSRSIGLLMNNTVVVHLNSYEQSAKIQLTALLGFLKNYFKNNDNWVLSGDFNINLNDPSNRKWLDEKLNVCGIKLTNFSLETPIKRQRSEKLIWNNQIHKGGDIKTDIKNIILSLSTKSDLHPKSLAFAEPLPCIKMGLDGLDHSITFMQEANCLYVSLSNIPTISKSSGISEIHNNQSADRCDLALRAEMMRLLQKHFAEPGSPSDFEHQQLKLKDFMQIISPAFIRMGKSQCMKRLSNDFLNDLLSSKEYYNYLNHSVTRIFRKRMALNINKKMKKEFENCIEAETIQKFADMKNLCDLEAFKPYLVHHITKSKKALLTLNKISSENDVHRWITFLAQAIISPCPNGTGYESESTLEIDDIEELRLSKVKHLVTEQLNHNKSIREVVLVANDSNPKSYMNFVTKLITYFDSLSIDLKMQNNGKFKLITNSIANTGIFSNSSRDSEIEPPRDSSFHPS